MATKGSSSCIKIIVGASSSDDDSDSTRSYPGSERHEDEEEEDVRGNEEVVPTFILQPREIIKNIDLMKTVAMLMENKLQQSHKGSDHDKMRDLWSDIQRFPEAYQKFTSIIHQIQYLNITTNWDFTSEESSNLASHTNGIMGKVFHSKKLDSPQDIRKRIMLKVLTDVQQVFNRYHKLQASLEDRLNRFKQLVIKKTRRYIVSNQAANESDDDDQQTPLLGTGSNIPRSHYTNFLEKLETLSETLRKTKRNAEDVQDSIEVLHELITWDHKQAVSESSASGCGENSLNSGIYHLSSDHERTRLINEEIPDVVITSESHLNSQICSSRSSNRKKTLLALGMLTGVVILLVAAAAFSFVKFTY